MVLFFIKNIVSFKIPKDLNLENSFHFNLTSLKSSYLLSKFVIGLYVIHFD